MHIPRLAAMMVLAAPAFAQSPSPSTIHLASGQVVEGRIQGAIALAAGFAGVLVAGDDIDRIDSTGIHVRPGSRVTTTILPLASTRFSVVQNPPFTLMFAAAQAKAPDVGQVAAASFDAPCSLFADTTLRCTTMTINVNVVGGRSDSSLISVDRVLGEFRLEGGTGTIRPQLTIVGTDRSQQSINVGDLPPVPKKTRAR